MLCSGYTLTDFHISIRLTSLALWQSNDCPSASIATLMNMDKYFMWIHYERLHNHNKAMHNKTHAMLSEPMVTIKFCNVFYSISQEICTRFCCALLCCGYAIVHNESHEVFIHIALLALGQSLDFHSGSEVSLMDMGKSVNVKPQQSTAKQKNRVHISWDIL